MESEEIKDCIARVRTLCNEHKFEESDAIIRQCMMNHPDAPEPHNLMGIELEMEGKHVLAMRHFRAAWALEPTYEPANVNMYRFGAFSSNHTFAFDESDCHEEQSHGTIEYGPDGIGRMRKNYETRCDENGIIHVVRR